MTIYLLAKNSQMEQRLKKMEDIFNKLDSNQSDVDSNTVFNHGLVLLDHNDRINNNSVNLNTNLNEEIDSINVKVTNLENDSNLQITQSSIQSSIQTIESFLNQTLHYYPLPVES
eukprot:CAMPEP_0116892622 /NCGR_PEP_ID=MMETSP0467-20121206/2800_1 /TAXON_ID=283647 /ORGANISM="Mesodinium pulex, Strain SPMC105" /LENGTH=114 /DNA_ID=CAMNT_0004561845 /DNA_START=215 /DNA_END=559 /DNA_ORIENTATION=-